MVKARNMHWLPFIACERHLKAGDLARDDRAHLNERVRKRAAPLYVVLEHGRLLSTCQRE